MDQKRIVIDGKAYKSSAEMPEEVRQRYLAAMGNLDKNNNGTLDMLENMNALFEDKNGDGMPDAFEELASNAVTTTKIFADGKEYNSMDELPPEVRVKLSRAMGKLDANQNGIPDFMEGTVHTPAQPPNIPTTHRTETQPRTQPATGPAIEPEPASGGWMIALAGLFVLILCAAALFGVWYFFLR